MSKLKLTQRTALTAVAVVVIGLAAGFVGWSATCPCERTPGAWLFGTARNEPVTDWTFANQVVLCQIQIRAGLLPHAINLNCFANSDGNLFLSCSQCDTKHWSGFAASNGWGRLRLDGTVYPVTLTRVLDSGELDRAWEARMDKLHSLDEPATPAPPRGTPRPGHWWSFRVESRS